MYKWMLFALLAVNGACFAAQPAGGDVEAIIKRLEESGALDQAIDRGIQRFLQQQQDAQRRQQEAAEAQRAAAAQKARKTDPASDHILGAPDAEVSIIEYSDFECPFCKSFHNAPQEVVRNFGGKVNLVWRQFPLDFHNPAAQLEAEASECAARTGGNEAFWKYTDAMMQRTASNGKGLPAVNGNPLLALARELNLNLETFQTCMDSGAAKQKVADDMRDGIDAGITGTPGVIIRNNKTGKALVAPGAVPPEVLESMVRQVQSAQ